MKNLIFLFSLCCFSVSLGVKSQTVPEYERFVDKVKKQFIHHPVAKKEFNSLIKKISRFESDYGDLRFADLQLGFLAVKTARKHSLINRKKYAHYCEFLQIESNTDCEEQENLFYKFLTAPL